MLSQLTQYANLIRLNKPIGVLLLLWPTLWALWLASEGQPDLKILLIFLAGLFLMRAAGVIVNDFADRKVDKYVARTRERPLTTGKISNLGALSFALVLSFIAFLLVLLCNSLTILLAFIGALLAVIYPFMKRYVQLPQLGLGMAYSWGVPMAFAAEQARVSSSAWILFFTCVLWPLIYDTMYAMVDRQDDLKIGIKSSAILFGQNDKLIIGLLQILFLLMLVLIGFIFHLHAPYYCSLAIVIGLFIYQQYLIQHRNPAQCFTAFLNNNWVGLSIFVGIWLSYLGNRL